VAFKQNRISISDPGVSWWIVFKDVPHPVIKRVLRPGKQHVFAVTRMHNLTLAIDPLLGAVNHILTDADLAEILAEHKQAGHTVVHFRHAPESRRFVWRGPVITCASYVAYTIGIGFFGVTAWQLYRKLMAMGGEEI
jgi:hypothetical protein